MVSPLHRSLPSTWVGNNHAQQQWTGRLHPTFLALTLGCPISTTSSAPSVSSSSMATGSGCSQTTGTCHKCNTYHGMSSPSKLTPTLNMMLVTRCGLLPQGCVSREIDPLIASFVFC